MHPTYFHLFLNITIALGKHVSRAGAAGLFYSDSPNSPQLHIPAFHGWQSMAAPDVCLPHPSAQFRAKPALRPRCVGQAATDAEIRRWKVYCPWAAYVAGGSPAAVFEISVFQVSSVGKLGVWPSAVWPCLMLLCRFCCKHNYWAWLCWRAK